MTCAPFLNANILCLFETFLADLELLISPPKGSKMVNIDCFSKLIHIKRS